MTSPFSQRSIQVCSDFLQTAVIIDDRAYHNTKPPNAVKAKVPGRGKQADKILHKASPENERSLDVSALVKGFAEQGIICSALEFKNFDENAPLFEKIAISADIAIIDWEMEKEKTGENALELIALLLSEDLLEPKRSRLISIYTGAEDLAKISLDIKKYIKENHDIELLEKADGLYLSYQSIIIRIFAKDDHVNDKFKTSVVEEKDLAENLIKCYSESVSGVLPNTVLAALTAVRNNSHKLLGKFPASLDSAFVAHRGMLPNPEDAGELLKDTICGEFNSILTNADITQQVSFEYIQKWISAQEFSNNEIKVKSKTIAIDDTKRNLWQNEGYKAVLKKEVDDNDNPLLNEDKINHWEKNSLKKHACEAFTTIGCDSVNSNEDFSILTHHKRNYSSTIGTTLLTLGVVIKEVVEEKEVFRLCIQQKCDSLRISKDNKRKFLFLPMEIKKDNQSFDVLFKNKSGEYVYLFTNFKECQDLEIIEFEPFEDSGTVQPKDENGLFYFTDTSDVPRKFQWILDLKEAHAQKIVNAFAAQLARVGLDESEWLRRT
jgi:Response receiver domain